MVVLTREQLEDRVAALHHASLELVSDLSSETVLERIVKIARLQVGARYAALGVLDQDGNLGQFIPVGMTQEEIDRIPQLPVGKGLLGLFRTERETVRIPEVSEDPRSCGFPPNHPEMHAFLGVPIMLGDKMLGQLYLADKIDHPEFTEQDESVIETLAAYAAVAVNNARMYEELLRREGELTQRNEDLRLLNDVAAALTGSFDVDEILDKTIRLVMDYLDVESGEIYLREDGEKLLQLVMHRGDFSDTLSFRDRFQVGQGYLGRAAETGEIIVSTNLAEDMRYLRTSVLKAGFQCIAFIPLVSGRNVIGVMAAATRRKQQFDERKLDVLANIGRWAGITIENAGLNRQSRRLAVLEERERIGMDLHDGIIQSIYGVGLALDYVRMSLNDDPEHARIKIEELIEDLNKSIRDIRAASSGRIPRQLWNNGFADRSQQRYGGFSGSQCYCTLPYLPGIPS
jgi:GAF domain-containing protein